MHQSNKALAALAVGLAIIAAMMLWPADTMSYQAPETTTVAGIVTAYDSEVEETDDTPFITANGDHVYRGGIANNCLPFGSKVIIEGHEYTVNDRMNARYGCDHFDIWMQTRNDAIAYGLHKTSVLVESYGSENYQK